MPPRYIHASEVGSFASCRRAWFLERHNQPTDLSGATQSAAQRSEPGNGARESQFATRLSLLLLVLGIGGIACVALLASTRP